MFYDGQVKALSCLQERDEDVWSLSEVGQAVKEASRVSALALHNHLKNTI